MLERGSHVSYGACGLPYNIEDPERRMDDLVVIAAEKFRSERGIDVGSSSTASGRASSSDPASAKQPPSPAGSEVDSWRRFPPQRAARTA